jgi:hypothetical protein
MSRKENMKIPFARFCGHLWPSVAVEAIALNFGQRSQLSAKQQNESPERADDNSPGQARVFECAAPGN